MEHLLNDSQLDKLSDILIVIGQVFFASIVVPFFFGLDRVESDVIRSGIALMLGSWIVSVLIVKRMRK